MLGTDKKGLLCVNPQKEFKLSCFPSVYPEHMTSNNTDSVMAYYCRHRDPALVKEQDVQSSGNAAGAELSTGTLCRIPAAGIAKDKRAVCRKRPGWQEESALEPVESCFLAVPLSVAELLGDGWQIEYFAGSL